VNPTTTTPAAAVRPLAGIRVISLAEQYPGPLATLLLSDLGADVVQVERPGTGDPSRAFPGLYQALNRGKRSAALDLKDPDGVAACAALVAGADVLLEGFRPGVLARLGLDPADLARAHPALVQVSVSGFGQTGPYRDRPAHDLSFQALAGLLDPAAPTVPHLALADVCSGVFTALAALCGLAGRASTGRGGRYDVAMFDTLVSFIATSLVPAANGTGPDTLGLDPGYGLYPTSDGRWLALSIAFEDHFWRALCAATELPDLAAIPAAERASRRDELREVVAARLATRPLRHWEGLFVDAGVAHGAVQDLDELLADPQLAARDLLQSIPTADGPRRYVRQPLTVDGTAPGPVRGVPAVGEHTREVLAEAGLDRPRVEQLLAGGAARQHGETPSAAGRASAGARS
jgi:crotonobetainyl-CoA:carnitine CoA-transferase CaiB-like acyl-CoA transferase